MKRKFYYFKSCVEHTSYDTHLLLEMIENAREIKVNTFLRNCNWTPLVKSLGLAIGNEKGLHLKDDYHVEYYRSTYDGVPCYYMKHSAIEYIFLPVSKLLQYVCTFMGQSTSM